MLYTIGQLVMRTRDMKGVSRQELAERLEHQYVGTVEKLENGKFEPSVKYLHKVAKALGVTIDKLLPQEWLSPTMVITANGYQQAALRTMNTTLSKRDVLINGVMGMCGEAGEAIDIVKKHLAQGHELDRDKLIKELGDVAWYLAETAYALDVPLEEVLQRNIDKLMARYPQGFEADKSLHRKAGDV
jgi:NTP pyrophosphatase (non-canonical NTP hydrolase)/DNA-binding XRE family transcriptional regulator